MTIATRALVLFVLIYPRLVVAGGNLGSPPPQIGIKYLLEPLPKTIPVKAGPHSDCGLFLSSEGADSPVVFKFKGGEVGSIERSLLATTQDANRAVPTIEFTRDEEGNNLVRIHISEAGLWAARHCLPKPTRIKV